MRKLKNALVLLLSAALLVLGAGLPEITARAQDEADQNTVFYGEMEAVKLTVRQENAPLPMEEKLALLTKDSMSIPEERAKMTPDVVRQVAKAVLQPYMDAGLILIDPTALTYEAHTYLYYDEENPERCNIVWHVSMCTQECSHRLSLILDDETGCLVSISYQEPTVFGYMASSAIVGIFSSRFLEPLSLLISDQSTIGDNDTGGTSEFYSIASTDGGVHTAVVLKCCLSPDGFFTEFLEEMQH